MLGNQDGDDGRAGQISTGKTVISQKQSGLNSPRAVPAEAHDRARGQALTASSVQANPSTRSGALTELRIEKLPATGATYYVNDAACPGLSVRVSAGGIKAFVFTKFKHGRLTRITLGRAGALRLDAARRAAQALHGELALGVDVGATRRAAKAQTKTETMQEAFERFMALKARRPKTVTDYQYLWRLCVPAELKRKAVKDVSADDLEMIKRSLGAKRRTANKVIILIGSVMAKSGRWADNPARGVAKHQERVRTRRLNGDELVRVWSALDSEPEWGDFFCLLILTGARRTPFCAMRWRDLNLEAGVWTVPVEWAKSKREMAIPLSSEAVRILRVRRDAVSAGGDWQGRSVLRSVTGDLGFPRAEMSESIRDNPNRRLSHAGVAIGDFALDP